MQNSQKRKKNEIGVNLKHHSTAEIIMSSKNVIPQTNMLFPMIEGEGMWVLNTN